MPTKTNQIKPKKIRWDIYAAITLIYEHLKDSKFSLPKAKKTIIALNRLNEYFGTDDIQTYIVVFAIWNHFDGNRFFTFRELAEYVDVTVFKISVLNPKLEQLQDKLHLMDYSKKDSVLRIKEDVITAIMNKTELEKKANPVIDYSSFVEHIYFKFKIRGELDISLEDFLYDLKEFEGMHKKIPFINRCRYRIKDDKTRFFYYDVCADKILDDETCLQSTINALYEGSERISVARQFMEEKHFLIKNEFLEFSTKGSITDAMLSLTQKGLELFLAEDASLYENKKDEEKMIKPESIPKKELFHSLEVQSQLKKLTTFMSQTKFQKIQKRLIKKGQCSGVTAILYGESGCGKTESVLQIAKATGRSILKIDISSTRSCWYGNTEKNIKKIFTSYRTACSRMPVTPILFFNEADAIFSVRRDASLNNTHQVDNTIQNILLEEMENFSGILIATTNLIRNLDSAFSRRFLFKISFDKPSFEAKKSIWLNKLPWLSQKKAAILAEYNLSGGDIDNIDRLIEMHPLTYGHRPNFKEIDELCRNAKINEKKETRIGFTND